MYSEQCAQSEKPVSDGKIKCLMLHFSIFDKLTDKSVFK